MIEHAHTVARLVRRGKDAYDADEMLRYAAEDLLIRLGECVSRIDRDEPAFVDAHPDFELRRLKDARNVIAHGYDIVDYELLWAVLSTNVPQVAARLRYLVDSTGTS
nr:HepT-like ribonuclease domain-containing protein [Cellulosimicrobium arenosum]